MTSRRCALLPTASRHTPVRAAHDDPHQAAFRRTGSACAPASLDLRSPSALAAASPPRSGRTARVREHLDVGENPPNGAIVYYWLEEECQRTGHPDLSRFGRAARSRLRSDDDAAPARRPPGQAGLNRFVVVDLRRHPGPSIDKDSPPRRSRSTAHGDNPSGPVAVRRRRRGRARRPGRRRSPPASPSRPIRASAPRPTSTLAQFRRDAAGMSLDRRALAPAPGRQPSIRRLKRGLAAVPETYKEQAGAAKDALSSRGVLVDIFHVAGVRRARAIRRADDELAHLRLAGVGISDTPPTVLARAVWRDLIAQVDAELARSTRSSRVRSPRSPRVAEASVGFIVGVGHPTVAMLLTPLSTSRCNSR